MFDKTKLTGADLSASLCGIPLQSPFILASGPLTYAAEGMIRGHEAGCGAVVTKTIRIARAVNPVRHISRMPGNSMINCEKWADSDRLLWYEREIPMAKKAGAVVIGSVGHTLGEARAILRDVEKAGADMIELVSYTRDDLLPMLRFAKENLSIPVICKLSGNWPDAAEVGRLCIEQGADGICAIDSIGPTLKIDIRRAAPEMGGERGYGWMTGAAIRPISMRINAEIASGSPGFRNLYGVGGCMTAEDAIEFLMVGCGCVGVCTAPILKGINYVEKLCAQLSDRLAELGYQNLESVRGAALSKLPPKEKIARLDFAFTPGEGESPGGVRCTKCGQCVTVCPYQARALAYPEMRLDRDLCRDCGLCLSVCPTGALTASDAVTDQSQLLAEEAAAFENKVGEVNR